MTSTWIDPSSKSFEPPPGSGEAGTCNLSCPAHGREQGPLSRVSGRKDRLRCEALQRLPAFSSVSRNASLCSCNPSPVSSRNFAAALLRRIVPSCRSTRRRRRPRPPKPPLRRPGDAPSKRIVHVERHPHRRLQQLQQAGLPLHYRPCSGVRHRLRHPPAPAACRSGSAIPGSV
jgi:hypothetical protein